MIGNGVSVLVTTVIHHFNYILINVKELVKKEYVKPVDKQEDYNITGDPEQKVLKWFKTRGISAQTLIDLHVGEGLEYMPQTGKQENTIKFNYFMGDQLINIKYRDGRKNFKLYKGAEKVFYNIKQYCRL